MAIQITWEIAQLECVPHDNGLENVVKVVHWRCEGADAAIRGSAYGSCGLGAPSTEDFTSYPSLTKETVLGWIWANGVDKEATEAAVANQIERIKNPPVVTPPLPWASN